MINLTPTPLIAIVVPEDANDFNKESWSTDSLFYDTMAFKVKDKWDFICVDFDFEILGTITATEVDFDAAPYGGESAIRSLLSSHDLNFVNPIIHVQRGSVEGVEARQAAENKLVKKIVIIKKAE